MAGAIKGMGSESSVRKKPNRLSGELELEPRRGVVVLATLSLLRRLETQDLLKSGWKTESGSPRRYYALNADGRKLLKKFTESWQGMNHAMDRLLKED